jgi:NADP-dependent 3-hydroxy acid dehydrogenase YdfG
MQIKNKVAIITGASAGIGLATARLFTAQGAKVAMVARSDEVLQDLSTQLPRSLAVPADFSDLGQVPAAIEIIYQHYGRVDVLVNNAGRAFHTPVAEANVQLYRQLLDLNVVSVVLAMQIVVPIMRQQGGGVIVNVSSGLSKRYVPGTGPYTSTKFALNALTLIARQELADENIRVGLVFPGRTINTQFAQNTIDGPRPPYTAPQGAAGRQYPYDTPEEVAAKILEAVQTEAAETYIASTQR